MKNTDYKTGVINNIKIMSRTLNGILDMSASATKADSMEVRDGHEAEKRASENINRALDYILANINTDFDTEEKLSSFFLKIAAITDEGIVKEDMLFRSGEDSKKYCYAKIADLEYLWNSFIAMMLKGMKNEQMSPVSKAAFAEYYINAAGHFFADGCGKISILISSYILMHYGCDLPDYKSRDEYYHYAITRKCVDRNEPIDEEHFDRFLSYYRTLLGYSDSYMHVRADEETLTAYAEGVLDESHREYFRLGLVSFYASHPNDRLTIDCTGLGSMTAAGTDSLKAIASEGKSFILENLNQDCYVAMMMAGLEDYCGTHFRLPELDVTDCRKLGEGANGIVYALNDEVIVKAFKREVDFDTILKERDVTRRALKLGIPCPITFGYVIVDKRPALAEEYVKSTSFAKLAKKDRTNVQKYMKDYVGLIKKLHSIDGEEIKAFPRKALLNEIMRKADIVDSRLDEAYRGKLRKILQSIDEPEVLIHGDIQPNNVRINDSGASFIDLETLSTGPAIIELGSLRRTVLAEIDFVNPDFNDFTELSGDLSREIWTSFVREYYSGEPEDKIERNLYLAEVIADILALSKMLKTFDGYDFTEKCRRRLQELVGQWDDETK